MGSVESEAAMERHSNSKECDPPPSPTLEQFSKDLPDQFDEVKGFEITKLSASEKNAFVTAKKTVKSVTMVVVFLVVLGATIVSKGATFLMVSQVSTSRNPMNFCSNNIPYIYSNLTGPVVSSNSQKEKVAWLWGL